MMNTGHLAPLTSMAASLSRLVQTLETKRDDAETKQKHRGGKIGQKSVLTTNAHTHSLSTQDISTIQLCLNQKMQ